MKKIFKNKEKAGKMQKNIDVAGEKIDKKSKSCQCGGNDFEKAAMLTDSLVSSGFVNVSMGGA